MGWRKQKAPSLHVSNDQLVGEQLAERAERGETKRGGSGGEHEPNDQLCIEFWQVVLSRPTGMIRGNRSRVWVASSAFMSTTHDEKR